MEINKQINNFLQICEKESWNDIQLEYELKNQLVKWRDSAQVRKQGDFKLAKHHGKKHEEMVKDYCERFKEMQLFDRYCKTNFLHEICEFIIGYQVPLRNVKSGKDRWGSNIDLLGCDKDGKPVLIELKAELNHLDFPANMLIEGIVYSLAFQKAWVQTPLKNEFQDAINTLKLNCETPPILPFSGELHVLNILCLAQAKYWDYWKNQRPQKFDIFRKLLKALPKVMESEAIFYIICAKLSDENKPEIFTP